MNQSIFKAGNYYKARIIRVEPTLEAAFVDYGAERHGFLPLKDIDGYDKSHHKEGSILNVCMSKAEKGQKGAQMFAPIEVSEEVTVHDLINKNTLSSDKIIQFAFISTVLVIVAIAVFMSN